MKKNSAGFTNIKTTVSIALVALCVAVFDVAFSALKEPPLTFPLDGRASGTFPSEWIHGSKSAMDNTDPAVQVHAYNDHTFILRENKAINYEGAFMYLFSEMAWRC